MHNLPPSGATQEDQGEVRLCAESLAPSFTSQSRPVWIASSPQWTPLRSAVRILSAWYGGHLRRDSGVMAGRVKNGTDGLMQSAGRHQTSRRCISTPAVQSQRPSGSGKRPLTTYPLSLLKG